MDDWGPLIRETLEQAAAEMSFADVPVGTFLSSGVDSSAVTAALTVGITRPTFTIGFEEEAYDERRWARQVAAQYGTEHTDRIVTAEDAETVFRETILWHYDEPLADHSYLPTYYVARLGAIVVALTGDGGDELFAGYGHRRFALRQSVDWACGDPPWTSPPPQAACAQSDAFRRPVALRQLAGLLAARGDDPRPQAGGASHPCPRTTC